MSENEVILPLPVIAQRKNLQLKDVLASLIPYNIVHAHVENVLLSNSMIDMEFKITNLPIPKMYLHIMYCKGVWEGNIIESRVFDNESKTYRTDVVTFSKSISISINDLFIYEHDIIDIESRNPNIFSLQSETLSQSNNIEQESLKPDEANGYVFPQSSFNEPILPMSSVKKRVSTEGQGNAQVRNTCRENSEAVAYVEARRRQGAKTEEIAAELKKAGGGVAVIGCLLDPTKANVTSARDHGKHLLKKAK